MHTGHRKRLREQFFRVGLDGFSDIQVLEFLLNFALARKDMNPLAHRLLEHFGSLPAVLDASPAELMGVEGVGENTATLLVLIPQLFRRYTTRKYQNSPILDTTETICNYIWPLFLGINEETVYLLCLDAKCKLLDCRKISIGGLNAAMLNKRMVVEIALQHHATAVILAHNHPWGLALPSSEDEQATEELAAALKLVDILLVDHVIVAEDECVSLAAGGFFQKP